MATGTIPCRIFTQTLSISESDIASGYSLLAVEIAPVSGYYLASVSSDNILNAGGFALFAPRYINSKWRIPVWSAANNNTLNGTAKLLWVKK